MPAGKKRYTSKQYYDLWKTGLTRRQVAAKLKCDYKAVCKGIERHSKRALDVKLVPEIITRYENDSAETERWNNTLIRLAKRDRFLRVAHINDLHFPYYDPDAFAMTCEVIRQFQPHIIGGVNGSDAMDNPTVSRWLPDRDIIIDDYIEHARHYLTLETEALRLACDDAVLVNFLGNHDAWAFKHIKETQSPRTLLNEYINIIRQKGQVIWLGATDRVHIGNLTVAHGEYATVHTAKKQLDATKYQENIMVGHTHRPDFYTAKGRQASVKAVVAGCNCSLNPHYQYLKQCSDWQHGTALATVDMIGGQVHFDNLVYNHEQDHLWTTLGGQVIQVKKQNVLKAVA